MTTTAHTWLRRIVDSPTVTNLMERLTAQRDVTVDGSQGSSTALLAAALAVRTRRPVLLVVAHLDEADNALDELALFDSASYDLRCQRFGALEVLPGETNSSLDLLAERLAVVTALVEGSRSASTPTVLAAPVQALMQSVPQPDALHLWSKVIQHGQRLAPAALFDWLIAVGYQRCDAIEQPGDFAVRGGIVDIFPPTSNDSLGPVRLDYFGDEVETICRIDTNTMGSADSLDRVQIIGAAADQLQCDERTTNLLRLIPRHTIVVMHEVLELSEQARGYYERLTDPRGIYSPSVVFQYLDGATHVKVNQYTTSNRDDAACHIPVRPLMGFAPSSVQAVQELVALATGETGSEGGSGQLKPSSEVIVLCQNTAEQQRLSELIREHAPAGEDLITIELGYLYRGFTWHDSGRPLHLVPHHELFHRYETRRGIRRISNSSMGQAAKEAFLEVAPGDFVVHVEHGIALFKGLRTMTRRGKTEEYLTLEFAKRSLLHVPATQIDLIQKYVGGFQGHPPLSMLGGKRWEKQKQAVAEAVKEMAAQLIRIQAARTALPGVRYPLDTVWQKEFEAEFPYEETEDQFAAVAQVKRDMADDQPMDRLICGDVGFGKTEIAIRAAFKAAEFGKQVAVLVPTTVLAEQHESTFRERTADYPFRIESISRFKTAKQQKGLLRDLAQGQIDVIIGTHRLLSEDVKFADLGLVVIDEEQRFGVKHKQKLFQFRMTAEVLTLTATPIPRTLHMAMLGMRDISSLSTPPLSRRAIVTEVIPYNEDRIRQSIIRELNRNGQVYFLHNRIYNIHSIADNVRRLVPDARMAIGHGQMSGRSLEDVMLRFVRRQIDVLVCTTIIESGIDIPTANTIIINHADQFGLADLHQLRGRVGRYKHRAYCYLMLPQDRPITDTAARRLKTIEQYSMLGAGFKIAMRDLEIRGAGNLLGAEQSGHIASVGYEMYCKLLELESRRLRNQGVNEPIRTHVELPVATRLPRQYIPSDRHRIEMYGRISRAATFEELQAAAKDMTDACGQPPLPAAGLLDLAELRIAASQIEVEMLKLDGPDLIFHTRNPQKLDNILKDAPGRTSLIDHRTVYYRPPQNYLQSPQTLLAILRKIIVQAVRSSDQLATTSA